MFDHLVGEWLHLGVRWLHVIAGIAWIGTSFYFNFVIHALRPPPEPRERIAGELWAIHAGGFFHVEKFEVAPERLPEKLHWFKWEAYTTWISGFALLVLIYYLGPASVMVDPAVADISLTAATAIGVGALVVGWLVYDGLCRTRLVHRPLGFGIGLFALIGGVAYGLSQVLTGRAAYIHVGALVGTLMAANVFRVIIPSQKNMVAAMTAGREPDGELGRQAEMRSLHNNYFTLPVVFIMISIHFPTTYGHTANWLILIGVSAAGVLIRHWFNLRGRDRHNAYLLPVATLVLVSLALVTAPRGTGAPDDEQPGAVSDERAFAIIQNNCAQCHSSRPTHPGVTSPPLGIAFETIDDVLDRAVRIEQVAVHSRVMPPGNVTGITDEERAELGRWLAQHD